MYPKKLFLIDSLGAVLTAFLLGAVLTKFESVFGMPQYVLYILAAIAGVFAVYSFFCYVRRPKNWTRYLKAIAIANLSYCCLTLGLVGYFYEDLTVWGVAYFLGEIVVVVTLATIELKATQA